MHKELASFRAAAAGIAYALRAERHMRFHALAALCTLVAGALTRVSAVEWALLFLCIAGMFACELLNTAIERAVDLASPSRHPLAKQAKDAAAGACLAFALGTIGVACAIFIPKWLHALF